MSEKFTASIGTVEKNEFGELSVKCSVERCAAHAAEIGQGGVATLREFFQHERDLELGRWRWPENPDYVVYSAGDGNYGRVVRVLHEGSGNGHAVHQELGHPDQLFTQAARDYFAAHPESKPWHDAKPGEVWALVTSEPGGEHVWMVDPDFGRGRFVYVGGLSNIPLDHPDITSGRRVWPEVCDD